MNIIKFTKLKSGQYKLLLENNLSIILHEDLILKNRLLITKKINEEDIDKLIRENINYQAYDLSLKYISTKLRSIYELEKYLEKKEVDNDIIDIVVNKLVNQGYLNDKNYCKSYIIDRINLSNDGPYKIKKFLKDNNISDECIESNMDLFTKDIQVSKIDKLISKKIKSNNNKGSSLLKQKIIMYLVDLGYDKSVVVDRINNVYIDDSKLYKKEYDKLYNLLSKRYKEPELELRIKNKLYQKGFRI